MSHLRDGFACVLVPASHIDDMQALGSPLCAGFVAVVGMIYRMLTMNAGMLQTNGRLILLGVPPSPHSFAAGSLLFKRRATCTCCTSSEDTVPFGGLWSPQCMMPVQDCASLHCPCPNMEVQVQADHCGQSYWRHQGDTGDAGLLWQGG